jgi:hypothetical protein
MKSTTVKITAVLLSLVLTFSLLSGCGNTAVPASEEPAIAKDTAVFSPVVTIVADGREITIEDTAGKRVQELLDMADVILGDHDVLSLSPAQEVTDTLTIRVLRSCTVTICIPTEDPAVTQNYTMVLVGATVADALAAAGLELADNQLCNFDLTEELTDGMEIVLSIKEEETVPEETETETTEETEAPREESTHSPEPTTPAPTAPAPTTPRPTSPAPTQPATTAPTAPPTTVPPTTVPPTTAPAPTEPPRTIVSVEIYEDCDGSGHGVKVITYSDGTQEEVYF